MDREGGRMADNLHSTLVAWFKVALPLAALAILSTLFLVARTVDPEGAIPFAEVDIADRLREPRLTLPTWAGVTDDGAAMTISADEARPGGGSAAEATAARLVAHIDLPDGGTADLVADAGRLDSAARLLTVEGAVVVTTSTGYRVESALMQAALDRTRLESPGAVTATGPLGRLEAGEMLMTRETDADHYVLRFAQGVKLLYDPAN